MVVGIIGLGLIGGSMAIDLKKDSRESEILGYDRSELHLQTAVKLGIIDRAVDLEGIMEADVIVLAVPVGAAVDLLPWLLDRIDKQIVTDVGSTKASLCAQVENHPKRPQYVSAHPMAGTEFSGPWAARPGLFEGCAVIICDKEKSSMDALNAVTSLFHSLHMRPVYMNSVEHDMHAAYVSHISHISSFALALTVLEKEEDTRSIFNLASGGFSSTVRLAKSSKDMWTPIFADNAENILPVLDTYVEKMQAFRAAIAEGDIEKINGLIIEANRIKKILLK